MLGFLQSVAFTRLKLFLGEKFVLSKDYTNGQIISALVIIVLSILLSKLVQYLIRVHFKKFAESTHTQFDDRMVTVLDGPVALLVILLATLTAVAVLDPPIIRNTLNQLIYALITIDVTWLIFRFIDSTAEHMVEKEKEEDRPGGSSLFPVLKTCLKLFAGTIAFILVIQNLGYSVSSLVAGFGIGGLAVALAARETLANIFGSLTIFLDKPFSVGDHIRAGATEGVVEDVGFRCTRIRTADETLVSVPNSSIANQTVENLSRAMRRRVTSAIRISLDNHTDRVDKAMEWIHKVIYNHPDTSKGGIRVYLASLTNTGMEISIDFFLQTTGQDQYLQARQDLYKSILKAIRDAGVNLA